MGLPPKHGRNARNQRVQIFFRSFTAEGDAEGTVHHLRGQIHGCERLTSVACGSGTARGHADPMILQDIDGILCRNAGDGQAEDMGRLVSAVDLDLL